MNADITEQWQDGELAYEDLATPIPPGGLTPEHVASYAEHKGLESRAQKLCYGICAGEKSNGSVGRVTSQGNRERLKEEYDVDYDSLAEEARNWSGPGLTPERAIQHLEEHGGSIAEKSREHWQARADETEETETDTSGSVNTSDEFAERLDEFCKEQDVDYSDLTVMTDDDVDWVKRVEQEMQEHRLDGEDLAVARRRDVEDVLRERERLTDAVDLPEEECRELALSSLRRLAGDGDTLDELTPAPKSGDPQSDDVTRYSDPQEAREIREKLERLEHGSGPLVRNAREHWERELEQLEQ